MLDYGAQILLLWKAVGDMSHLNQDNPVCERQNHPTRDPESILPRWGMESSSQRRYCSQTKLNTKRRCYCQKGSKGLRKEAVYTDKATVEVTEVVT